VRPPPGLECGSLLPLCLHASLLAGCLNHLRYAEQNTASKLVPPSGKSGSSCRTPNAGGEIPATQGDRQGVKAKVAAKHRPMEIGVNELGLLLGQAHGAGEISIGKKSTAEPRHGAKIRYRGRDHPIRAARLKSGGPRLLACIVSMNLRRWRNWQRGE
jgi:hypothetical protein